MEDIREAYLTSRVFIAPMRIGTGLQNKLLEAMALKIPAITTPLANAALHAKPEEEILIGEDAKTLAHNLLNLLSSEEMQHHLANNAYYFVHKNFSWEGTTAHLEGIINRNSFQVSAKANFSVKEF